MMHSALNRPLLARLLMIAALGSALAGCLLTGYAWVTAVPDEMVGETTGFLVRGPLQSFVVCAAVGAVTTLGTVAIRRRSPWVAPVAAYLVAFGVPGLVYAVYFTVRFLARSTEFGDGLGTTSTAPFAAVGLAMSVAAAACTAAMLFEASTGPADRLRHKISWSTLAIAMVAIVAVAATFAASITNSGPTVQTAVTTSLAAGADASPSAPTAVAYRLRSGKSSVFSLVRVGGGFVARERDRLVAYDGRTGEKMWSRDTSDIDRYGFGYETRGSAVMIANESPDGPTVTLRGAGGRVATLDALTGKPLWWTADATSIVATDGHTYSDALVVIRRAVELDGDLRALSDDPRTLVSIDPRTGATRWSKPLSNNDSGNGCSSLGDVIGSTLLFASTCGPGPAPYYVDVRSGAATGPDLASKLRPSMISEFGDRFLVETYDSADKSPKPGYFLYPSDPKGSGALKLSDQPISEIRGDQLVSEINYENYRFDNVRTNTATPLTEVGDATDGQRWVWNGETVVGVFSARGVLGPERVALLNTDGRLSSEASPCIGGGSALLVMPVSGALLVACGTTEGNAVTELVGLR